MLLYRESEERTLGLLGPEVVYTISNKDQVAGGKLTGEVQCQQKKKGYSRAFFSSRPVPKVALEEGKTVTRKDAASNISQRG